MSTAPDCVFCEIIRGERLDTEILYRETWYLVLTPINPVTFGHVLFLPADHLTKFSQNPELTGHLVSRASIWAFERHYDDANIIISQGRAASMTVMHIHVHLVPRSFNDGLVLPWGKQAHEHKPKSIPLNQMRP